MDCCEKASGKFCGTCGKSLANLDTPLKHLRHMETHHKARPKCLNDREGDNENRERRRKRRAKTTETLASKLSLWVNQLEELLKGREA